MLTRRTHHRPNAREEILLVTLPKVIGELTPAAYDELISQVLAKHKLPRPSPDEDVPLEEVLGSGVPFDEIRAEIYQELRIQVPAELPFPPLLSLLRSLDGDIPVPIALRAIAEVVSADWTIGNTIHRWIDNILDPQLEQLADQLALYALTGITTPAPERWFGDVVVVDIGGQVTVAALASQLTDIRSLIDRFRRKCRTTFPRKPPKLSRSMVPAATALRQKLEGRRLRDIADIYIAGHPSEFPADPLSPEYRAAKKQLEQRMKKQTQRLREMLRAMGDT
jgi:hypothetical protein